jgi:hypothetical protein
MNNQSKTITDVAIKMGAEYFQFLRGKGDDFTRFGKNDDMPNMDYAELVGRFKNATDDEVSAAETAYKNSFNSQF